MQASRAFGSANRIYERHDAARVAVCDVEPTSGRVYCDGAGILVGRHGRRGKRRKCAGRGVDVKYADGSRAVIRDVHGRGRWRRLDRK